MRSCCCLKVNRLLVAKEVWRGPPGSAPLAVTQSMEKELAAPCLDMPRLTPAAFAGSWNVFTVGSIPVQETDPMTGELVGRCQIKIRTWK